MSKSQMSKPEITEEEYNEATENYMGWCKNCKEFTTDSVEPDAYGYECEKCSNRLVYGAEEALMQGMFDFKE